MSAAAEQAGELSPSEKLFAERRMGVDIYQAHGNGKEAMRLIGSIPEPMKDVMLASLLYVSHDEDLSGAIIDMQADILTLITNAEACEIAQGNYDAHLANMKRSQQRSDDRLGGL